MFALIFTRNQRLEPKEDYFELVQVGKSCLTFSVIGGALSIYIYFFNPSAVGFVADSFGILGSILAAIQYFPQIYTTLHIQHAGSLSIPMMCMQTPGGFAWSFSLAIREGTKWSSWMPYFTAAFLQGILLAIAVYFELRNKRRAKAISESTETTENTPLILP